MHLTVKEVSKTLDRVFTLDHLSLQLAKGEFVVIIGPSGCGKSTLFHIVAGLMEPDGGTVWIDGRNWTGQTGRISYMQQKDLLLPSRNVLDNVSLPLRLKGLPKAQARHLAEGYLPDFGLAGFGQYYPCQLSGGMRQRAALLRTYLQTSDILLLDEPFATLDAISRHSMQLWLKDLQARYGLSVLFITHDIEEALLLADRIYLLTARPARVRLEIDLHQERTRGTDMGWLKQHILTMLQETPSPD